jgi:hypothetical protein
MSEMPLFCRTLDMLTALWVPKTCAIWPDAPPIAVYSPRHLSGRGMIFGLWA